MRTITLAEVMEMTADTFSVKDNSIRGCKTVGKNDLKIGDKIVIDNHFTLIETEKVQVVDVWNIGLKEIDTSKKVIQL